MESVPVLETSGGGESQELPHLHEEIQERISKRLPTKSLICFRKVSKPWKTFIESPQFIADYKGDTYILAGPTQAQEFVLIECDESFPQNRVYLPHPDSQGQEIAGSCYSKGLLLLLSGHYHYVWGNRIPYKAVIWNPAIRISTTVDLPVIEMPSKFEKFSVYSGRTVGLGVRPTTNDPMLVSVTFKTSPWKIQVYSTDTKTWKEVVAYSPSQEMSLLSKQKGINGAIYFLTASASDGLSRSMAKFDLERDMFTEIPLPHQATMGGYITFSEHNSKLALIRAPRLDRFELWEMDDSDVFTKLYDMNLPNNLRGSVVGFRNPTEVIIKEQDGDGDIEVGAFEGNPMHSSFVRLPWEAHALKESLLLLNH